MSSSPSSSKYFTASTNKSSSIRTHATTSTDYSYRHEPFETFRFKAERLCQSIGFGESVVEKMHGGSFNRVLKVILASGDQYVLRVPRNNGTETAQDLKDHVAINSYAATYFPVPEIIAYDSTADNAIDSPYIIQKFAQGQCLEKLFEERVLAIEDHIQIASIVAGIFARMEKLSFPTPGRLVTATDIPDRCDDFSILSTNVAIAPFKTEEGEVLASTSSPSVADFLGAILDMRYENSQIHNLPLLQKWTRLREINQEMKSRGLLNCEQSVLWHWDFAPRNILVNRKPDNSWEITAVLDWDGALCVPRVLTREPLNWLWQVDNQFKNVYADGFLMPRRLTVQEESIKKHFEDCIKASIDIENYRADAYDRGYWARQIFGYAQYSFSDSQDGETYEEFIKDWETYCLKNVITKIPEATKGKEKKSRHCLSWLDSALEKISLRRLVDEYVVEWMSPQPGLGLGLGRSDRRDRE
ncbi:hypothetical protein MMC31_006188 [Peltigera leucophlebia]|nr:hypothetical protein [Peltigera leucophlebia]